MVKGKITIEDLAVMVQRGFSEMNDKLNGHDKRFDSMDKRFDSMDKRLKIVEDKVSSLTTEFQSFRSETRGNFEKVNSELYNVNNRLDRVEKRTIEDADAISENILDLTGRVSILERNDKQLKTA